VRASAATTSPPRHLGSRGHPAGSDRHSDPVDPLDPNDPVDPNDPNDPNDPDGGNEDITGGCAAGGPGASTGLLLVAGLLFVVRRRRTGAIASR
jgi:uncharacterized protein (TIGR03382 family)